MQSFKHPHVQKMVQKVTLTIILGACRKDFDKYRGLSVVCKSVGMYGELNSRNVITAHEKKTSDRLRKLYKGDAHYHATSQQKSLPVPQTSYTFNGSTNDQNYAVMRTHCNWKYQQLISSRQKFYKMQLLLHV